MDARFKDRREAGAVLALALRHLEGQEALVLALPRGGVPVAYEVASLLGAPLDVFVVRKLGVPGHEEVAMGAVASGGGVILNRDVLELMRVGVEAIREVAYLELAELWRREALYRAGRAALAIAGKTVVLVDDGLATGATMRAAAATVRLAQPRRLILAAPVAARGTPAAAAIGGRGPLPGNTASIPRGKRVLPRFQPDRRCRRATATPGPAPRSARHRPRHRELNRAASSAYVNTLTRAPPLVTVVLTKSLTSACALGTIEPMTLLEQKILQHVHESWRKTLAGPQRRTCDVLGELGPTLPVGERSVLPSTLASLVARGWLIKHAENFYEATDRGEAALAS